jgi:hypothetical protein
MILTIDQAGRVEYIAGHGIDLDEQGRVTKRRASHVEPCSWPLRLLFHAVRSVVADSSAAAAWTRSWACVWRVRVLGGPVLAGGWRDRQQAIAAEVQWLERERLS